MTRKIPYYALAVVVAVAMAAGMVIGTAGAVLADYEGKGVSGTTEYSVPIESEMKVEQSHTGEIREPVETGGLPDEPGRVSRDGWVNISPAEQDSSMELRGLPNIQSGGGGE